MKTDLSKYCPWLHKRLDQLKHNPDTKELRKLAENNPDMRRYVVECLSWWLQINEIIIKVKWKLNIIDPEVSIAQLKLKIIKKIGRDKALLALYHKLESSCYYDPETILKILEKVYAVFVIIKQDSRIWIPVNEYLQWVTQELLAKQQNADYKYSKLGL